MLASLPTREDLSLYHYFLRLFLLFLLPLLEFDPVNYSALKFGKPFFLYNFFPSDGKNGGGGRFEGFLKAIIFKYYFELNENF